MNSSVNNSKELSEVGGCGALVVSNLLCQVTMLGGPDFRITAISQLGVCASQQDGIKADDTCHIAWSGFLQVSDLPYMVLCSWCLSDSRCGYI